MVELEYLWQPLQAAATHQKQRRVESSSKPGQASARCADAFSASATQSGHDKAAGTGRQPAAAVRTAFGSPLQTSSKHHSGAASSSSSAHVPGEAVSSAQPDHGGPPLAPDATAEPALDVVSSVSGLVTPCKPQLGPQHGAYPGSCSQQHNSQHSPRQSLHATGWQGSSMPHHAHQTSQTPHSHRITDKVHGADHQAEQAAQAMQQADAMLQPTTSGVHAASLTFGHAGDAPFEPCDSQPLLTQQPCLVQSAQQSDHLLSHLSGHASADLSGQLSAPELSQQMSTAETLSHQAPAHPTGTWDDFQTAFQLAEADVVCTLPGDAAPSCGNDSHQQQQTPYGMPYFSIAQPTEPAQCFDQLILPDALDFDFPTLTVLEDGAGQAPMPFDASLQLYAPSAQGLASTLEEPPSLTEQHPSLTEQHPFDATQLPAASGQGTDAPGHHISAVEQPPFLAEQQCSAEQPALMVEQYQPAALEQYPADHDPSSVDVPPFVAEHQPEIHHSFALEQSHSTQQHPQQQHPSGQHHLSSVPLPASEADHMPESEHGMSALLMLEVKPHL